LVPFWTKRNPDYGSKMKTINCRDDSLLEDRGMWTTMKKRKRCIIIAQGFFEWLKKGNQKIPHFTKRRDGQLMCLAGLWDSVQFEGKWPVSTVRTAQCDHLARYEQPKLHCMPESEQFQVASPRATFSLPCAAVVDRLTAR
jgi:putative SOS response-associated peptidase YedK